MKKRRHKRPPAAGKRGRKALAKPRALQKAQTAEKLAERQAAIARAAVAQDKLTAQAWRLASRFGYILDVDPGEVFAPTRGHALVETVRHLTAHVLLEIDRARPTDLNVAMRRDRQTLRNSFKRAWDLREEPDVATLILFVSETRKAKYGKYKRAARPAREAFAAALSPTGRGGRYRPEDFQHALKIAAQRFVHGAAVTQPEDPRQAAARVAAARPPAAIAALTQVVAPELPAAARILEASPLTKRLLGETTIAAKPTAAGGARVEVTGRALKGDMSAISAQLARVLETAGFTATLEGVFALEGTTRKRTVLRVAPAGVA